MDATLNSTPTDKTAATASAGVATNATTKKTVLTRVSQPSEHFYIYLTLEIGAIVSGYGPSEATTLQNHKALFNLFNFREMLASALNDLFGSAFGGGIRFDILEFWTQSAQDPFNTGSIPDTLSSYNVYDGQEQPPSQGEMYSWNQPISLSAAAATNSSSSAEMASTYSATTAASSVLRCHADDGRQLWNALTLFSTTLGECEVRIEVKSVSSTLMGLKSNS
ncbi:hypothetical protein BGW38_008706, partial [Lunasporangiospora selenospora]